MKLTKTDTRLNLKRAIKRALICSLVVMATLTAIIANTVIKQREASGDVLLELCEKTGNGQWVVIDRARGKITASASLFDVATGKEFNSNLKWEPRSEKGRQIILKQLGAGKAGVDPVGGDVTLEIPFDVSVDGRSFSLTAKLTNKTTTSPVGSLTGRKLESRGASLSASVAGFIEIKEPSLAEALVKEPGQLKGQSKTAGGSDNKDPKKTQLQSEKAARPLIVVIKAEGSSTER